MTLYASFDPIEDHYRFVNELGRKERIRDSILVEMHDLKHDAVERIDAIVHPEYVKDFIKILTYAHSEGLPEAGSLAKKLGLNQLHFASLDGDERYLSNLLEEDVLSRIPDDYIRDMCHSNYYDEM